MDIPNNCKLAVLYLLKEAEIPLTKRQLDEILLGGIGLNYFDVAPAIAALANQRLITNLILPGGEGVQLTQAGKQVILSLESNISPRLYELLKDYMQKNKKALRLQNQRGASYESIAFQQYVCNLFLADGDLELLRISVNVVSDEDAKTVCQAWRESAPALYTQVLEGLLGKRENITL